MSFVEKRVLENGHNSVDHSIENGIENGIILRDCERVKDKHDTKMEIQKTHQELDDVKDRKTMADKTNQILKEENRQLRDQLQYIQDRLRHLETAHTELSLYMSGHGTQKGSGNRTCDRCTYVNPEENGKCEICGGKLETRNIQTNNALECD